MLSTIAATNATLVRVSVILFVERPAQGWAFEYPYKLRKKVTVPDFHHTFDSLRIRPATEFRTQRYSIMPNIRNTLYVNVFT